MSAQSTSTLLSVAGHSFDESLLPERATVLDVGCRGFDFAGGIRKLRPHAYIYTMDPDPEIKAPEWPECAFLRFALVHDGRRRGRYASYSTGEGNFLTEAPNYYDAKMIEVDCISLQEVTALLPPACGGVWDLIKLDCEGSEFGLLENWPGPIARQLSVEFHDYNKPEIRDGGYYERLFSGPLKDYRVVQHDISLQGKDAYGHWDSILILK